MRIFCAFMLCLFGFSGCSNVRADSASNSGSNADKTPFLQGIDVSHYQGSVDWDRVTSSGIAFAFAKEAQGGRSIDPLFSQNWANMRAAGIVRGAYDFYDVGTDPDAQLENFTRNFDLKAGDLPPVVDIEAAAHSSESVADLRSDLARYLAGLEAKYGAKPIIYTSASFWDAHVGEGFGEYPLWVAHYNVSAPRIPTGWSDWTFWQHSQDGSVSGISGAVDLNYFQGDQEALSELLIKE